ncbi:hypothetical protein [Brevibacterium album]|uniref:hypothetical protein n=1 Tax=Brevibacterium album TaxID=417948 RepID=UPI0004170F1E|nr:hypothetical protein [Brevibacterium album]
MEVLLIGAAGRVGTRLAAALTAHGDTASGMHRSPDQADTVASSGATPVAGDLIDDTVDELALKRRSARSCFRCPAESGESEGDVLSRGR